MTERDEIRRKFQTTPVCYEQGRTQKRSHAWAIFQIWSFLCVLLHQLLAPVYRFDMSTSMMCTGKALGNYVRYWFVRYCLWRTQELYHLFVLRMWGRRWLCEEERGTFIGHAELIEGTTTQYIHKRTMSLWFTQALMAWDCAWLCSKSHCLLRIVMHHARSLFKQQRTYKTVLSSLWTCIECSLQRHLESMMLRIKG